MARIRKDTETYESPLGTVRQFEAENANPQFARYFALGMPRSCSFGKFAEVSKWFLQVALGKSYGKVLFGSSGPYRPPAKRAR